MEWLRENCFLVGGDNVKRPVYISTVRTSPYEMPSFEGYFRDVFSMYPKTTEKKDPIKKVIFNDPATIVMWDDGTKTVVKCQPGDTYDAEKGLAMCIAKKYLGNKGNFNEVFKKWVPYEKELVVPTDKLAEALKKLADFKLKF